MPLVNPQRILVRGVNWLGDAVMTTPALLRLRQARPNARITLLTPAKLADLWQAHPAIDAVEVFSAHESPWRIGLRLRREKFEVGLVLPNSTRSALEIWVARIPERIGCARPGRNWMLTRAIPPRADAVPMRKRSKAEINRLLRQPNGSANEPPPAGAHHIHQYLHLTAALGAQADPLPPQLSVSRDALSHFMGKFQLTAGPPGAPPWFGLNTGAEYGPAKRWPEERFTRAAIEIQKLTRCRWLLFGLPSERDAVSRVAAIIQRAAEEPPGRKQAAGSPWIYNLAGLTTLGELCAALKLCRVVLTNDSGPMHVAAALGTPVVVPFGSTSPELTGPGAPGDARRQLLSARAPCSPCFLRRCPIDFRCMTGITEESVVQAVLQAAALKMPEANACNPPQGPPC